MMRFAEVGRTTEKQSPVGGIGGWLLGRLQKGRTQSRLEMIERIALAPRQSLALVEADGRRFLVATSHDGAPAFYALDGTAEQMPVSGKRQFASEQAAELSW